MKIGSEKAALVIGAGLAGLSAAYKLGLKAGTSLFKRRGIIGGRVFSHHFRENPDLYCAPGGEWVGEDHNQAPVS